MDQEYSDRLIELAKNELLTSACKVIEQRGLSQSEFAPYVVKGEMDTDGRAKLYALLDYHAQLQSDGVAVAQGITALGTDLGVAIAAKIKFVQEIEIPVKG